MFKIIFILSLFSAPVFASEPHCTELAQPVPVKYCVHAPVHNGLFKNRDILYYFHGRNGNELRWSEDYYYTGEIRKDWKRRKKSAPTVVSISFGPVWLLGPKNQSPVSGLLDFTVGYLMPRIEKELGGLKGKRLLLGESMGGVNALILSMKADLFERVVALCAPVAAEINPFSTADEVKAYVETTTAWKNLKGSSPDLIYKTYEGLVQLSRAFFPTPQDWTGSNPMELAKTLDAKKAPEYYLAAGMKDEYLPFEGNQTLAQTLKSRKIKVDWRPAWGGHCIGDVPTISKFLVK